MATFGIQRGRQRPRRHSAPKAKSSHEEGRRTTPSSGRGARAARSVRLFALGQGPAGVGHPEELEVVVAVDMGVDSSGTLSTRIDSLTTWRSNAGTTGGSRSTRCPSAPNPTRATRNSSGSSSAEQSPRLPSAGISRSADDLPAGPGELYAGAVGRGRVAAATVWTSMSPRFGIARPRGSSTWLSSFECGAGLDGHPFIVRRRTTARGRTGRATSRPW